MNSYRRGLRNGVLVNPKQFILQKFNFGPYIKCWSNLVKLSQTWSNVFKLVLFGAGHYIIPPAEDVAVRPYLVPLLSTFHGMENENPYTHIRDFEEVCTTSKEGTFDMDLLKLKAFPLTLKDKAKIWLNSLRPRTIRNWAELQAEFLKKFFSAHKTNNLKRKIYTFVAHDSERFYQCWERYLETISACPHHVFDTWMLVNHFCD